jgi:hypothetical protein
MKKTYLMTLIAQICTIVAMLLGISRHTGESSIILYVFLLVTALILTGISLFMLIKKTNNKNDESSK